MTNEVRYLGPEEGRPGRPTQAVRHTFIFRKSRNSKQNAFKFEIAPHNQKYVVRFFKQEDESPLPWPTGPCA
jgi:hypothetical protein